MGFRKIVCDFIEELTFVSTLGMIFSKFLFFDLGDVHKPFTILLAWLTSTFRTDRMKTYHQLNLLPVGICLGFIGFFLYISTLLQRFFRDLIRIFYNFCWMFVEFFILVSSIMMDFVRILKGLLDVVFEKRGCWINEAKEIHKNLTFTAS